MINISRDTQIGLPLGPWKKDVVGGGKDLKGGCRGAEDE